MVDRCGLLTAGLLSERVKMRVSKLRVPSPHVDIHPACLGRRAGPYPPKRAGLFLVPAIRNALR